MYEVKTIRPGDFDAEAHWYEKVQNATIHPQVSFFLNLAMERVVSRYCHLHPKTTPDALREILAYKPRFFNWAGADLFNVTSENARRQMMIIETNSCPSGQKSMPLLDDALEQGGYARLINQCFKPVADRHVAETGAEGALAVIYDKNLMEASGYAAAMADAYDEPVYFIKYYNDEENPVQLGWEDGQLTFEDETGETRKIRATFRYLTQKPWNRLPVQSRTFIFNPVIACLAGGRNKMLAAKAYDFYNTDLSPHGLKINTPETIWDVRKREIPLWVQKLGGQAVVKVPYSNAGQGVFTIIGEQELEAFMEMKFPYDAFIVQSLVGNYNWSSTSSAGRLYHVGTMPDTKGNYYVADVRMMICSTEKGMRPLTIYARRAAAPMTDHLAAGADSWEMLGTNLSVKLGENKWGSDTSRLMMMDRKDFNKLGLGLDDLIEAFIQTVLSVIAIDKMAAYLIKENGRLDRKMFASLNDDAALIEEIAEWSI